MSYIQYKYPELTQWVLDIIENSPNEHTPESLGLATGLNQYAHCNSSPRMVMLGSHLSQAPVIYGAAPRRIYSGMETKYGEGTWKQKLNEDAVIKKVIPKYPTAANMFKLNPSSYVIYQTKGQLKTFNLMQLDLYHSTHQSFGYKNVMVNHHLLRENQPVLKDTVFSQSPNIRLHAEWVIGKDLVVANISLDGVIEDGVIVCEDVLDDLTTVQVGKRSASSGKAYYLLNTYGTKSFFKGFPDIGEHVRECGLLFAMRKFDSETADIDMDIDSMQYDAVDTVLDRCVYAVAGAKITDIHIMHSHLYKGKAMNCTPVNTEAQIVRYYEAEGRAYKALLDTEAQLRREFKHIELSPALERLCVEAEDYHWAPHAGALKRTYRATPLDEWNIDITFAHDYRPNIGSKISGLHGDKSVICGIWPRANMPTDEWGRSADIISAGGTTINRMNVGRLIEQYLDASAWHFERHLRVSKDPEREYLEYLALASPISYSWLLELSEAQLKEQVAQAQEYLRYCLPPHSPNLNALLPYEMQKKFPVPKGHLRYIDPQGKVNITVDKIMLGCQHIIVSEKNGYDWASVADDAKCQIYGPPAKLSNADKYSSPRRRQTTRGLGEAESRNLNAVCGPVFAARILEYQNNPDAARVMSRTVLTHPTPTNIDCIISDAIVKPGFSRPSLLANHIINVAGVQYSTRMPAGERTLDSSKVDRLLQKYPRRTGA